MSFRIFRGDYSTDVAETLITTAVTSMRSGPRVHVCDVCNETREWDERWQWYGSFLDEEDEIVITVCGCRVVSEREAQDMLIHKRESLGLCANNRRKR